MAALNFPTSPTLNQIYTANGSSWSWDGTSWVAVSTSLFFAAAIVTKTAGYTLTSDEAWASVQYNSASAGTFTIPANSTDPIPVGTEIEVGQIGTGALTIAGAGGVTVNSPQGVFFNKQNQFARLRKTATDTWSLAFYGFGARADLPAYAQTTATGSVTLDRNNGECQRLSVTGNVTGLTINNFGISGSLCKLVLEIWNTGAYTFTWPAGTVWPGGIAPVLTSGSGKKDVVVLMTMDAGTTVYGTVVGQNFT